MGIFLSRFGLLMGRPAAGDGGGGSSDAGVIFEAAFAGPGHSLSNDDRTLVNTGGGSDYRWWMPATKLMPGSHPVPFYWEFEANPAGPAGFNGYHAVVSQAQLDDPADTHDSGQNPIYEGSVAYRGNGDVWGNTGTRIGTYTAYGAGDVVMMAFDPATGGLWIGLNGAWENDPDTDAPNETSTAVGSDFWPAGQGRDPDEGGTLRSLRSQFSYPVPERCIALGESLGIPGGVAAQIAEGWTERGGDLALGAARLDAWVALGNGAVLGTACLDAWHEMGGGVRACVALHDLWIERNIT
jgi:hypothetical protein